MKRDWLYIISPCIIAIVLFVIGIITSMTQMEKSGGWSFIGVIICFPALIIALALDIMLKYFIKKTGILWLIEAIIVILGFLLIWSRFGS